MEELENQLPQGGEEEIVEEEELALPDMTDLGGAQLEAVKQANEQSSGILGIANQVSGAIEDAAVNVRDFVDNTFQGDQRSKDQIREDRATIREESKRRNEENIEQLREDMPVATEVSKALIGGKIDAVESVGSFAKLSVDSMNTGLQKVMGKAVDPTNNPFSDQYQSGSYFEIPDIYEPQNTTALGKLGRGLVEFGTLTQWTGGGLSLVGKGLTKVPQIKAAGAFVATNRPMQFLTTGMKITAEGGLAELISESSEYANIANLAQEHTPWLLPGIMERLAVDEDDTAWEARLKTVTTGAGLNHIGYFFSALIRGGFKTARSTAREALKNGKSLKEAVDIGNKEGAKAFRRAMLEEVINAERAAQKLSVVKLASGKGIDPMDPLEKYVRRHLSEEDLLTYDNVIQETTSGNIDTRVDAKATIEELTQKAKNQGASVGDNWNDKRYSSTSLDSENAGRQPDPTVNPEQFDDFEKVSYAKDVNAIDNMADNAKKSEVVPTTLIDEADIFKEANTPVHNAEQVTKDMIERVSGGDQNLAKIFREVMDDFTKKVSKTYKSEDYERLAKYAVDRAEPFLHKIADFTKGDVKSILNEYKKRITALRKGKKGSDEYRTFSYGKDPETGQPRYLETIGPLEKDANMIILNSIAKTISDLSTGALEMSNGLTVYQNYDKLTDLMKEVFIKTKEYMYAWGTDGLMQQGNIKVLDTLQSGKRGSSFAEAVRDGEILKENMKALKKVARETGDETGIKDLMRIFAMTDGDVLSLDDIGTYLRSYLYGGNFLGYTGAAGQRYKAMPSKVMQEIMGVSFNALLGRVRTPVKAIVNTGFLAYYKGIMKALGFLNPLSISRSQIDAGFLNSKGYKALYPDFKDAEFLQRETLSALFELDNATKSMGDTLKIFLRNYKLGFKKKDMDYVGKYAIERRTEQFKDLQYFKNKYTDDKLTDMGYAGARFLENFNTNPYIRHSTLAMGAGDAAARYNIGMQRLASEAFHEAMESGASVEDFVKFRDKYEELFESKIFRYKEETLENGTKIKHKIVSDKLARLGGDEATLTKNLEGIEKAYTKLLGQIPGSSIFFKFLTPAINGLKLGFDHSPAAAIFNKKYHAMLRGDMVELQKYGITARTLPGEIAEMEGKMAFGTGIIAYMARLAATGRIVGDYPRDPGDREMWQQAGIKPLSFRFKVPLTDQDLYVGFSGAEIWTTFARVVANLIHEGDILGESEVSYALSKLSFIAGTLLVDNGPLQGLTDFANIFQAEKPNDMITSSGANVLGSFAPFTGQFADITDLVDGSMKELESLNEKLMYRTSVLRPALPQRYDVFNEKREAKKLRRLPDNFFLRAFSTISPIGIDFEKQDPITDALLEIRYDLNANMTSYKGEELTGPEQSEFQRQLAMDPHLRKELLNVIESKPFKESLAQYKADNRKVDKGLFSKSGRFGISGDEVGGYDYKNAIFYQMVDNVMMDAKQRAMDMMLSPDTKFGNLKDPKSLQFRINVKEIKSNLENEPGYSVDDINAEIEEMRKVGY